MESKKLCCPRCKTPLLADSELSPAFPFCSKRCKLIDLGAWANEEYSLEAVDQSKEDGEDSDEQ